MIKQIYNDNSKWLHCPNFQFYLTDACQLNCEYCFRKEKRASDHSFNLKIDKKHIKKLCNELKKINFICSFTLIGGEPTLILNFEEICNNILEANEKIYIKIYTNLEASYNFFNKLKFIDNNRVIFNISYHNLLNESMDIKKNRFDKFSLINEKNYYDVSIAQLLLDNDKFHDKFHNNLKYWDEYNLRKKLNIRYLFNNQKNCIYQYKNKNIINIIQNIESYDTFIYKYFINNDYYLNEWELINSGLNNFYGYKCKNNSFSSSYLKTGDFFMHGWEHVCLEHMINKCKSVKYEQDINLVDLIYELNNNYNDLLCSNNNCFRFDTLSYMKYKEL